MKNKFKIIKNIYTFIDSKSCLIQALTYLSISVLLYFIIELLSQRSLIKGLTFIVENPLISLINISIIYVIYPIILLSKKRRFLILVISLFWLILGIINFILQCFRLTPISAMDMYELAPIFHNLPTPFVILIGAVLIILLAFVIYHVSKYIAKTSTTNRQIKNCCILLSSSVVLMILLFNIGKEKNILDIKLDNLHSAYHQYGFVYCLTNSFIDLGIDKPVDYSKDRILSILDRLEEESVSSNMDGSKPNIIMVQLESFFYVNALPNIEFSENPIPNFIKLKEEFSHGYLAVPSLGAGTVNTEFEVLTGMNTDFFGTFEYPYRTILLKDAIESICTNLNALGYNNYAIHNNKASFYRRNEVFKRIGFDYFSSIETMENVEYTPTGWAKDSILFDEITKALNTDSKRDFIYSISVQPHGDYISDSTDYPISLQVIDGRSKDETSTARINNNTTSKDIELQYSNDLLNQLEYYVNQLAQTDQLIGDLTSYLVTYAEPTIVVFFGDHLPPLDINYEALPHSKYQTEYVLWSNYPMEQIEYDINAYELNAYILHRVGINEGVLTKFHQTYNKEIDYMDVFKLLQYDMLYGKKYVFGGVNPYKVKELKIGIN